MKRNLTIVGLISLGVLIAFPLFIGTMTAMVSTSTPEFCSSCHEIRPAVRAWTGSTHVNNAQGLVANCMDCHLPPPENTFDFFFKKTYHGTKDVIYHFLKDEDAYDRKKARQSVYKDATNNVCIHCHKNVLYMPHRRGAMLAHRSVVYALPGDERKCIDCHYDLVHDDKETIMYRVFSNIPYQAKGLRPEILGRVVP